MSSCDFDAFVNLFTFVKTKRASSDFAAFSVKSSLNQLPGDAIYGETIHDAKKLWVISEKSFYFINILMNWTQMYLPIDFLEVLENNCEMKKPNGSLSSLCVDENLPWKRKRYFLQFSSKRERLKTNASEIYRWSSEHTSFFKFPVLKCSSVSQAKPKSSTIENQGRTVKWCKQLCYISTWKLNIERKWIRFWQNKDVDWQDSSCRLKISSSSGGSVAIQFGNVTIIQVY